MDTLFGEDIFNNLRLIAGITRIADTERKFIRRKVSLLLQDPNGADEELVITLEDYELEFDSYYKATTSLSNLITKMWRNADAAYIKATTYDLCYKVIRRYASELGRPGDRKHGENNSAYYIERENWIKCISQCTNGLIRDFPPFYDQFRKYAEHMKLEE